MTEINNLETETNPWDNAQPNTLYYDKIYDDGHFGNRTESPMMAYKMGWFDNQISLDDVQISDVDGRTYLKSQCPMKSNEAKLQEAKERKHTELRNAREQLRYTEFAHYDNDDFQIRPEDQDNINTFYASALAMKLGAIDNNGFGLMSETNTLHYFTADQIIELMSVMKAKVEEIYQRYWYARDVLLENALTIEEVESIVIPNSL